MPPVLFGHRPVRPSYSRQVTFASINQSLIDRFALFTLTNKAERDDNCADIYHQSLLYLESNAFEDTVKIPMIRPNGEPILGMQRCVDDNDAIVSLSKQVKADRILSPNTNPVGSTQGSRSTQHCDFDDDEATVKATLARILEKSRAKTELAFHHSGLSHRRRARYGAYSLDVPLESCANTAGGG